MESKMTVEELANWIDREKIVLLQPGTFQWQDDGVYSAYKNGPKASCTIAENRNPVRALLELKKELEAQP
jgi:hypothetical protein